MGSKMSIDETTLSSGERHTVLTDKAQQGQKGCLAAIIAGTESEEVIVSLQKMPREALVKVEEITLDMSESMRRIARTCFAKSSQVIDRCHGMQSAFDATREIRIKHRREAIQAETDAKENTGILGKNMLQNDLITELHARYCLPEAGICYLSRARNGVNASGKEPAYFLKTVPTSPKHTR
jgi:transposase